MLKLADDGETFSGPGLGVKTAVEAQLPTMPPPFGFLGPRGGASPPAGIGHSIRCHHRLLGWLRPCQGDVRKRTVNSLEHIPKTKSFPKKHFKGKLLFIVHSGRPPLRVHFNSQK